MKLCTNFLRENTRLTRIYAPEAAHFDYALHTNPGDMDSISQDSPVRAAPALLVQCLFPGQTPRQHHPHVMTLLMPHPRAQHPREKADRLWQWGHSSTHRNRQRTWQTLSASTMRCERDKFRSWSERATRNKSHNR